jgi:hypothetical protein
MPSQTDMMTPDSLGVTFSQDYYAQDTPKLVLGFTTDAGRLWWSLGTIFQNPFQNLTFNVSHSRRCLHE